MLLSFFLSLVLATDDPNAGGGDDAGGAPATEEGSGSITPAASGSSATTQGSFAVVASAVGSGVGSLSAPTPTPSGSLPANLPSQVPPGSISAPSSPQPHVAKIPIYPPHTSYAGDPSYMEEERLDEGSGQVIHRAKCTQCKSFRGKWLCKSCVKRIPKHKNTKKKNRKKVRCVMQNGKKICGKALD